jgi:hypothetical protein
MWFSKVVPWVLMVFLEEIKKFILKFIWICQGFQIVKTILTKNQVGGDTCPDFKTDYKATVPRII